MRFRSLFVESHAKWHQQSHLTVHRYYAAIDVPQRLPVVRLFSKHFVHVSHVIKKLHNTQMPRHGGHQCHPPISTSMEMRKNKIVASIHRWHRVMKALQTIRKFFVCE
eukprot:NODE_854_length_3699_cov_0.222500.p5 type:complete len:108 gc:universal NODE_854_length_3699_cov_0.222500:1719-1396(-)